MLWRPNETPNFQALREKNEGLGNGRVKIDSLLTKEEVEFVDRLIKTRTRLGMNQTQLANVLGTSTGTPCCDETVVARN